MLFVSLINGCIDPFGGTAGDNVENRLNGQVSTNLVRAKAQPKAPAAALEALNDGGLTVLSIFSLTSPDPSFGGLSGLWLSPQAETMIAISDRGQRWKASLRHDDDDRLIGIDGWSVTDLPLRSDDHSETGSLVDAEAMSGDGEGGIVLSYEGEHRLRRCPSAAMSEQPEPLPPTPGLGRPGNSGIEALAILESGQLFALAERAGAPRNLGLLAWIIDDAGSKPLAYIPGSGFSPTGADRLGDQIYLVERSFSLLGGFRSRIAVLPVGSIKPGAVIEGKLLSQFKWGALGENFEAIAARSARDGRVLLYVLADDNFSFLQKTLLLQLSLSGPEALAALTQK